tara:strand:+ start:106 stop:567 length:462 start_codon:yes stop_codon:yes gene_type:complete
MVGVVGKALRGFGKALAKKGDGKRITRVPIAKNLTTKRNIQDKVVKAVDEGTRKGLGGATPTPHLKQSMSKSKRVESKKLKDYSYKYDEIVAKRKKYNKNLKRKVIGGASAAVVGAVGAHGVAKKKFPKYKKVMESDVVIKDGKLGLRPKKKK